MIAFKSLFVDHVIYKRNSLITNPDISLFADHFSMEDGAGIQVNYLGYGNTISICKEVERVCKPNSLNKLIKKFDKQ